MNKEKLYRLGVCVIIALTTLVVIISAFSGTSATRKPKPISIEKASSAYKDAVSALRDKTNLSMTVTQTSTTTISGDAFGEESKQTITYTDLGTPEMRGSVDQTLSIGTHIISIQEVYGDNTGYFTVAGIPFSGSITQEEYLARYTPVIPITKALYGTISGQIVGNITEVHFSDPIAPEPWLAPEYATVVTGSGIAYIDSDGNLYRSDYKIAYTYNGIEFHKHFTVEITDAENVAVKLPEDPSQYTKIQYLDAPRRLEEACGYLMAADSVTAKYTNDISYQAYGDQLTEEIKINIHKGNSWAARIDTNIRLTNASLSGDVSAITQTELFTGGKYTFAVNADAPTENPKIDETAMKSICRDLLIGTVMLPEYILDAKQKETDTTYRITITATEDFAKRICSDISQRLYQEATMPEQLSQDYKTKTMGCYLEFDKKTGLPIGSGIEYVGALKKDGVPYSVASKTSQEYDLLSESAYTAIYKKAGA